MLILFILNNIINFVLVVVIALISVAFLTLLERKVLASMQLRMGPYSKMGRSGELLIFILKI